LISLNIQDYNDNVPSVITVGTFDGIHLGHRKLIEKVLDISKSENLRSIVLTFDPHPRVVLNNDNNISLLTTLEEKNSLLESINLDYLIIQEFSKEFSSLTPLEYVKTILVEKLNAKHVVIGYDHRFGKNRKANSEKLHEFSDLFDFKVTEVDVLTKDNISVSSTKVRNLVFEGRIREANALLGYEFILTGKVIKGLGRGKNLGFPTANIVVDFDKIKPANGVYFINSEINGEFFFGMMNIGQNPTFTDKDFSIEVNFFYFENNLYEKRLTIKVIKKIRDEIKFDTPELLSLQLEADKKKCFHLIRTIKKTI
tara:strand:+ start:2455 stop:3390 length:936 start_codon:yes stop_codon:yes gene_type:complete